MSYSGNYTWLCNWDGRISPAAATPCSPVAPSPPWFSGSLQRLCLCPSLASPPPPWHHPAPPSLSGWVPWLDVSPLSTSPAPPSAGLSPEWAGVKPGDTHIDGEIRGLLNVKTGEYNPSFNTCVSPLSVCPLRPLPPQAFSSYSSDLLPDERQKPLVLMVYVSVLVINSTYSMG